MEFQLKTVNLSSSAPSPGMNWSGTIPIPAKFDRWIRSKDFAITAFTPCKSGPLAAQSRDEPLPYSAPAKIIIGVPKIKFRSIYIYICRRYIWILS
jgi:hypothetical protein